MSTETGIANAADTIETNEATDSIPESPMRILKVGTTSSLSNRSTLGYAIGCDDTNAIFLSLRSNTAAGMFSTNWIAFLDIAEALVHADKITSATLSGLYANTSRNNAGFMLAVLLAEGLVSPIERYYTRNDFKPFLQHINSLIDAGVDLGDADEALAALETHGAVEPIAEQAIEVQTIATGKRGRPSKRA